MDTKAARAARKAAKADRKAAAIAKIKAHADMCLRNAARRTSPLAQKTLIDLAAKILATIR